MGYHRCHCGEAAPVQLRGALSRCALCGRLRDDRWARATTLVMAALGLIWLAAVAATLLGSG